MIRSRLFHTVVLVGVSFGVAAPLACGGKVEGGGDVSANASDAGEDTWWARISTDGGPQDEDSGWWGQIDARPPPDVAPPDTGFASILPMQGDTGAAADAPDAPDAPDTFPGIMPAGDAWAPIR